MSYYHGGAGGLQPGNMILPPGVTGAVSLSEICGLMSAGYGIQLMRDAQHHVKSWHKDKVYATQRYDIALEFACYWSLYPWCNGNGSLYRVTPTGKISHDLAFHDEDNDTTTIECESAVIDEVVVANAITELPALEKRGLERLTALYRRWLCDHGEKPSW